MFNIFINKWNAIDSVLCNRLVNFARPVAYIRFGRRSWLSLCLCNLATFRTADTNELDMIASFSFFPVEWRTENSFRSLFRVQVSSPTKLIHSTARDSGWYFKRRKKRRAHVNGKVSAVLVITQLTKGAALLFSPREIFMCVRAPVLRPR